MFWLMCDLKNGGLKDDMKLLKISAVINFKF